MVLSVKNTHEKTVMIPVLYGICGAWLIASLFLSTPEEIFSGLMKFFVSPVSLTTDTLFVAGKGGAVVNAALVGLMALALIHYGKDTVSGTSLAAFSMTVGFSFVGINALNFSVLFLGAFVAAKLDRHKVRDNVNSIIFSGTLAPIISELLFGRYIALPMWIKIICTAVVSVMIGLAFPFVCKQTEKLFDGYNLFNAGVAGGFCAMLFYGIYKNCAVKILSEDSFEMNSLVAGRYPSVIFAMAVPITVAGFVAAVMNNGLHNYGSLVKSTGHNSNFADDYGMPVCLVNYGIIVSMMVCYYFLSGVQWTAGAVCAIFGAAAWAAAGAHPGNILPIILGYVAFSIVSGTPLSANAFTIGLGYATGLVPIAGEYGVLWGILCGFLHCAIIADTGLFHGGFCLYNGGFTSGFVAAVIAPVAGRFSSRKRGEEQKIIAVSIKFHEKVEK